MSLLEQTDIDIIVEELIDTPDRCEGPLHPYGGAGHEPSEYAAYFIVASCGHDWLACESWTMACLEHGGAYRCDDDGVVHPSVILAHISLK